MPYMMVFLKISYHHYLELIIIRKKLIIDCG